MTLLRKQSGALLLRAILWYTSTTGWRAGERHLYTCQCSRGPCIAFASRLGLGPVGWQYGCSLGAIECCLSRVWGCFDVLVGHSRIKGLGPRTVHVGLH